MLTLLISEGLTQAESNLKGWNSQAHSEATGQRSLLCLSNAMFIVKDSSLGVN